MKNFFSLSIASVFSVLILISGPATAGRGEQSFTQHMSAAKISNEFGHTYRYQNQEQNRSAHQYQYTQKSQWSNGDKKQAARKSGK